MRTFVLGIGAQKAGTTWLHQYLVGRPDTDFGFTKEYHIFDAIAGLSTDPVARVLHGSKITRPVRWAHLLSTPEQRRRYAFCRDPQRYFDYFQSRVERQGISLTGDITPAYSMLSAATLRDVRQGIVQRGMTCRLVFLMRDPIERIISQVRMRLRKTGSLSAATEVSSLRTAASSRPQSISGRSDYRRTLEAVDASLDQSEVFVEFYERLFRDETIQRLCAHLDVPYIKANYDQRVNVGRTDASIPDDVLLALGEWQRDTWRYCRSRFRDIDLETLWPTTARWCSTTSRTG